jgi:hypothetical protein
LSIKFIHQNCAPELADDRSLPYTAYLVEYDDGVGICYDIVMCNKKADIFDYYWDKYREGFKTFTQSEGRTNPKLWGAQNSSSKKKK